MIQDLKDQPEIAIDTETYLTSDPACDNEYNRTKDGPAAFDPHTAKVRLIQLKGRTTEIYLIDLLKLGYTDPNLKAFLETYKGLWLGHNIKFDIKMLKGSIGSWLGNVWCTMQASVLIRNAVGFSERGNRLSDLARDFLDINLDKTEQISDWSIVDLRQEQYEYAALDVINLHQLYDILKEALTKEYSMTEALELEMGVILPTARMEYNGIPFDSDMYDKCQHAANFALPGLLQQVGKYFSDQLGTTISPTYIDIHGDGSEIVPFKMPWGGGKVGKDFLMSKTANVLPMLQQLGLDVDNVQRATLDVYKETHKGVGYLIDFYTMAKQAQFDYRKYLHPVTGRVHPNFRISGATTGRFSCTNPNVQQIPSKVSMVYRPTNETVNYRYCFKADPGWLICSADFSGQELAVMSAMSGDPEMCRILNERDQDGNLIGDLHSEAAAGMFNMSVDEVKRQHKAKIKIVGSDQTYRDRGKIVMFSLAYGKTAKGFAQDWGISEKEAKELIKGFENRFPTLTKWLKLQGDLAVAQGYSKLANGATRFVGDLGIKDKEAPYRAGMNFQIQGLSSWMTRLAMIKLDNLIQTNNLEMQLIACIHDELLVTFNQDHKDYYEQIIGQCMKEAGDHFLKGLVPAGFSLATKEVWSH